MEDLARQEERLLNHYMYKSTESVIRAEAKNVKIGDIKEAEIQLEKQTDRAMYGHVLRPAGVKDARRLQLNVNFLMNI